jgi:APA family basic amino acid/polyamine antiporter
MGSIVGTGIFTLQSAIAKYGMAGIVGFLIATVGAIALALVFASLSRIIPAQGGPYAYEQEGFGDGAGFMNAFSYWCAAWPGNAGIVLSWVFHVQALFGWSPLNNLQSILIAMVGLWLPQSEGRQEYGWISVADYSSQVHSSRISRNCGDVLRGRTR